MLRWMIDMKSIQAGAYFQQIILTKYDKINFQKFLAPDNDAKNKSSVGTFIILEEIGFQYFSHTQRVLDKKLCLIEI